MVYVYQDGILTDCRKNKDYQVNEADIKALTKFIDIYMSWSDLKAYYKLLGIDLFILNNNSTGFTKQLQNTKAKTIKVINHSTLTDLTAFFSYVNAENMDLSDFDTSHVKIMNYMFSDCTNLKSLDLTNFNTENVSSMRGVFFNCCRLADLNISSFNTMNLKDMAAMFLDCRSLTEIDVSKFNTSLVTNMSEVFSNCRSLTKLDLSNFSTANVTDFQDMFDHCTNLRYLNLSSFDLSRINISNYKEPDSKRAYMFECCENLSTLITKDKQILDDYAEDQKLSEVWHSLF